MLFEMFVIWSVMLVSWSVSLLKCLLTKCHVCFVQQKEEAALKRKSEYDTDGMSSKNQRVDGDDDMSSGDEMTCDLIVLGIPWKASDQVKR